MSRAHTAPRLVPALTVVVGALVLITYSVGQWRSMVVPSWDLAIFSELAKAYAHLEAPVVPIKGEGFNLLGDHFHPVLVLLAPLWRLFPSPLALLVVQDLLLALSAWPLTRVACRVLGRVPALALGLVYVLSWGFQGAVEAQFHEIAFALPLLAFSCAAFVERRWSACAAWALPLVLVKEDLGLTVLMIGLAVAWRGHQDKEQRTLRLGLGLALLGVTAFLLTVLVLLPAFSPSGTWQYGVGGNAGDGSAQGAGGLLSLFSPEVKLTTVCVLACTAGVVGLGSPLMAAVLPTLAWRFLSGKEFYWDWAHWHYNAVLVPIALGALLDVLARARRRRAGSLRTRALCVVGVLVPVLMAGVTARDLPLAAMTEPGWGQPPARAAAAQEVIEAVPQGSSVVTDLGLLAYLVPRATVYWVGTADVDTDYVVIDSFSSAWGGSAPTDAAAWATQRSVTGATYTNVLSTQGYQVAKKNG